MNEFFGGYRAEWLKDQLFEIFTAPAFFPELQTRRACFLFGGRGTGKTTLLRALSFEGQFALNGGEPHAAKMLSFVGLYHRIDLNRITAFDGPELSERDWARAFGHYVNLELCDLLIAYARWYEKATSEQLSLAGEDLDAICMSLHLGGAADLAGMERALRMARVALEAGVNNIADVSARPRLSVQRAPIDLLLGALRKTPALRGRDVFFLIDEYESLLEYQQRCYNTLIKYSGDSFSFKIGVKELGLKTTRTLNPSETLSAPADYSRIDISNELSDVFATFADRVVAERFRKVFEPEGIPMIAPHLYFPGLSEEDEAMLLGVAEQSIASVRRLGDEGAGEQERQWFGQLRPYDQGFLNFLAESDHTSLRTVVAKVRVDGQFLESRRSNYGYAFLFTLKRGRTGIRKYYSGWDTMCGLAGANIRYLLHLVDQAVLQASEELKDLTMPIPPDIQTRSAQVVGRRILTDIEGASREGARLTKLLLGLGRVFQVMAESPEGHTPEVNQFYVRREALEPDREAELDQLLRTSVMHLALVRITGSKPTGDEDTRDWEFMLHPIFAPYFNFSHRKKRKIGIKGLDVLSIAADPGPAIRRVLSEQHREVVDSDLPEQMQLFEAVFANT